MNKHIKTFENYIKESYIDADGFLREFTFYRLLDTQTDTYLGTGNSETLKELTDAYVQYVSGNQDDEEEGLEYYASLTTDEIIQQIKEDGFIIEDNTKPFDESEIGNEEWNRIEIK